MIQLLEALIALERLLSFWIETVKKVENEEKQAAVDAAVTIARSARTEAEKLAASAKLRESFGGK